MATGPLPSSCCVQIQHVAFEQHYEQATAEPSDQQLAPCHQSQLAAGAGPSLPVYGNTIPAILLDQQGHSTVPAEAGSSIITTPLSQPLNYVNLIMNPIPMSEGYRLVQRTCGVMPHAAAYNSSSNNQPELLLPPQDFSVEPPCSLIPLQTEPHGTTAQGHGLSQEIPNLVPQQVLPFPSPSPSRQAGDISVQSSTRSVPSTLQNKAGSSSQQLSRLNVSQQPNDPGQSLNGQQNIPANSETPVVGKATLEPAALTSKSAQLHHRFGGKPVNVHNALANKAADLANLLPTGTLLIFQSILPSFSNNGKCQLVNKVFVGSTILVCALVCFLSSFTDSLYVNDKLYYGFATTKGLYIFNYDDRAKEEEMVRKYLPAYKIQNWDYIHAFCSSIVFLVYAISSAEVISCYFADAEESEVSVILYLPLVAGVLSSCLFSIKPTKRKGIGYGGGTANRVLD